MWEHRGRQFLLCHLHRFHFDMRQMFGADSSRASLSLDRGEFGSSSYIIPTESQSIGVGWLLLQADHSRKCWVGHAIGSLYGGLLLESRGHADYGCHRYRQDTRSSGTVLRLSSGWTFVQATVVCSMIPGDGGASSNSHYFSGFTAFPNAELHVKGFGIRILSYAGPTH